MLQLFGILSIFALVLKQKQMTGFWLFLGDLFQAIFKVVPFFGLWMNKLLIVIGFIAFFGWLRYMIQHKEVTKWD